MRGEAALPGPGLAHLGYMGTALPGSDLANRGYNGFDEGVEAQFPPPPKSLLDPPFPKGRKLFSRSVQRNSGEGVGTLPFW